MQHLWIAVSLKYMAIKAEAKDFLSMLEASGRQGSRYVHGFERYS